jgi:hypothetical protein
MGGSHPAFAFSSDSPPTIVWNNVLIASVWHLIISSGIRENRIETSAVFLPGLFQLSIFDESYNTFNQPPSAEPSAKSLQCD